MNAKTPHFKLYLKLKQQECIIDKSIEAFLVSCKFDTKVCHNIKRTIDQSDRERKELVESLSEIVSSIYQELKAVKATINEQKVEKIDVEDLKRKLQSLWSRIEEFKKSCNCIDTLKAEQSSLEADLNALQRSIRKHKNFSSAGSLHCKSLLHCKSQASKDESAKDYDYEDVDDFCTLLAKTGHTGNWSEEDHLFFVRTRNKHRGIAALVGAIQARCPDLTKESIVNHEAWYRKYLELREKQRLAVREWRQRRDAERSARRRERQDAPAPKPPSPLVSKKQPTDEEEQAEEKKREALRRWREERDKARAAEQERARSAERAKLESAESRRRARDAEIKRILAERREKRETRLALETEQCVKKPSGNSFILQYYRARDQEYLEKRKSILMSKKSVQPKQFAQPLQCNIYKSNESTLFKETKAWQDKMRNDDVKPSNTVSYIKDLPKRTLASWRSFEITS